MLLLAEKGGLFVAFATAGCPGYVAE